MTFYPRIFYLTVRRKTTGTYHNCRTLAFDRDEAERQAVNHYGPLEVASVGTCNIPFANDPVYGRGRFLPSKYDHFLSPQTLETLTALSA